MLRFKNPRVCKLILTYACNLNCTYCFEKYKSNDSSKKMSLDVAKKVVTEEIKYIEQTGNFDGLSINLFGGEPLLCFELIKSFCEWLWSYDTNVKYVVSITSNGTLLTEDKKEWFRKYREKISLRLSIDGDSATQLLNRGVSLENIPVEFVRETWPNAHFSMTVSLAAINNFASDFITLTQRGYKIEVGRATGVEWTSENAKVYEEQLTRIAQFYLENPQYPPISFFLYSFTGQLADRIDSFCGAGHHMVAYDYTGKGYPCHMFLPFVWGRDIFDEIKNIDFGHPLSGEKDSQCEKCEFVKCCPTCICENLQQCGDIGLRDKRGCAMLEVEMWVLSSFQIHYYMKRKNELSREEQVKLKAAVEIYYLVERRRKGLNKN